MIYIHPTAIIGHNVIIEDDVYIGPYCIIGMPAEYKGKEDIDMGVRIKKGSRLTGLVTVDSGVESHTEIGENCYLMKHSHVGHDATICNNVTISCGAKIGGHTIVGDYCNIGLNAVIHQRQIIRHSCMIGASAFVSKTLKTMPCRKYAGVPARDIGENIKV